MALFQSVISLHMSVLTDIYGSNRIEELSSNGRKSPDVDRGWAFVIVIVSFFGHILVYGPSWSFGILYITFLEEFEQPPSITAWIGTISAAFTLLGGPVGSIIVNRFGDRTATAIGCIISTLGLVISFWATDVYFLYFSFGILAGIGWSISYIPLINVLSQYFHRYRKIALGCCTSGLGMGLFIYPPLLTILIDQFHWRGTMLIIGAINLNLFVVAAAFMKPRMPTPEAMEQQVLVETPHRRSSRQSAVGSISVMSVEKESISALVYLRTIFQVEVFNNPHFLCMAANNTCFAFCVSVVFTHLSNLAKSLHFHLVYCNALISAVGGPNVIGRLFYGLLMQHPGVNIIGIYVVSFIVVGLTTIPLAFYTNYPLLVIYAAIFGFFSAAFGTVTPEVIVYICGLKRLASAYGYILVFEAIGMVMGGPAAGWVLESFNEYHGCFIMAGILAVLSGVIMIPSWWILARYRTMADAGCLEDDENIES